MSLPVKVPCKLVQTHPRVGVVGGTAGTGAQFARLMRRQGFSVQVSGLGTEIGNDALALSSDILIFAPPLAKAEEIIAACIGSCTRVDQLVCDLCSLKRGPMQAMSAAKGEVVGLHPLFGPRFEDVSGQDMVLCRALEQPVTALTEALRDLLAEMGLVVHEMTAVEHDRLMATVQVIPHLNALVNGTLFRKLGIDVQKSLEICSPVYKTEMYMMGRVHSQNPALYASIIGRNPHSQEIAGQLQSILGELLTAIANQDVCALGRAFADNQEYLGEFPKHALEESQRLLLAAFSKSTRDGDE